MEKNFNPKEVESRIYEMWEKSGCFTPKIDASKKPFTILLPPPNANAALHLGHAMYTVEDILVRWHRMKGDPTLWLPGADHAGFETQVVYEKHLAKEGKSRFDFDRAALYKNIWDFVQGNKSTMENQLRRLGYSLDWSRNTFTLDEKIIKTTYKAFKKLFDEGLIYRDARLVNYCTKHGTGFSDLEIEHEERVDPLYYMKYGPFVLATVRPETKFGDTAVAVNPKDKRYNKWIGKEIEVEGLVGKFKVTVIGDDAIDPSFGTGVAKVTPAHDFNDFEIAKRHNLPMKQIIGFDGRLSKECGPYAGMKVKEAREKVALDLEAKGLMDHIDHNYNHTVSVCYKCGTVLEPLPLPQWYVKTKTLAEPAIKAVKSGAVKIVPKRFEKIYFNWMENIRDWNISRQIAWGISIPAWQCMDCGEWAVTEGETPSKCKCGATNLKQDGDTFDTWFSSGQWAFATLNYPDGKDYKYFYPTSVMETAYEILFFWVARMMMLGIYMTGKPPFETVYLHGLVRDPKGQKMSKSKGNVVNPMELVDKYGADAVRMSLVVGNGAGADQSLQEEKMRGYRNFANKVWNIGRFVVGKIEEIPGFDVGTGPVQKIFEKELISPSDLKKARELEVGGLVSGTLKDGGMSGKLKKEDVEILEKLEETVKSATKSLENFRISDAGETVYQFIWHEFADKYIESVKGRLEAANDGSESTKSENKRSEDREVVLRVLEHVLLNSLKLLHPFMPFVTEEVWGKVLDVPDKKEFLMASKWPA